MDVDDTMKADLMMRELWGIKVKCRQLDSECTLLCTFQANPCSLHNV